MAAMEGEASGQFLFTISARHVRTSCSRRRSTASDDRAHRASTCGRPAIRRMIVNKCAGRCWLANFDLPENFQRDKNYQR